MRPKAKKRLILAVKLLIFLAVLAGIANTVRNSLKELEQEEAGQQKIFSASELSYPWLGAACGIYLLGMVPSWIYWHQVLHAMHQRPTHWEAFRAFYMSHLGKYVPGKAMVVVFRTGSIRSERVNATVAATSVFVETLTLMAVGAAMSAGIIAVLYWEKTGLVLLGLILMLAAGVPTLPPIFRRVVRLLLRKWSTPQFEESLAGVNFRLMLSGWILGSLTWCCFGLSLWATLKAMPGENPSLIDMPFFTACIAISTVAGFVSMIPGGLGVREWVMMELIDVNPSFSKFAAVVSAVLTRLAWLLSEVLILIMLYVWGRARRQGAKMPSSGTLKNGEEAPPASSLPKGEGIQKPS